MNYIKQKKCKKEKADSQLYLAARCGKKGVAKALEKAQCGPLSLYASPILRIAFFQKGLKEQR